MAKRKVVAVYFVGGPGSEQDKLCNRIFEAHNGRFTDCGTFAETYERNVEYEIPIDKVDACVTALKAAGFNPLVGRRAVDAHFEQLLQKHFSGHA
jgi:hypothetical protein